MPAAGSTEGQIFMRYRPRMPVLRPRSPNTPGPCPRFARWRLRAAAGVVPYVAAAGALNCTTGPEFLMMTIRIVMRDGRCQKI